MRSNFVIVHIHIDFATRTRDVGNPGYSSYGGVSWSTLVQPPSNWQNPDTPLEVLLIAIVRLRIHFTKNEKSRTGHTGRERHRLSRVKRFDAKLILISMYSKQPLALTGGKGRLRRGRVDWRQREGCVAWWWIFTRDECLRIMRGEWGFISMEAVCGLVHEVCTLEHTFSIWLTRFLSFLCSSFSVSGIVLYFCHLYTENNSKRFLARITTTSDPRSRRPGKLSSNQLAVEETISTSMFDNDDKQHCFLTAVTAARTVWLLHDFWLTSEATSL